MNKTNHGYDIPEYWKITPVMRLNNLLVLLPCYCDKEDEAIIQRSQRIGGEDE